MAAAQQQTRWRAGQSTAHDNSMNHASELRREVRRDARLRAPTPSMAWPTAQLLTRLKLPS